MEVLNLFMRGVGMDFERRGQRADRGKCLCRLEFTADENLLRSEHDLVGNEFTGFELEAEYSRQGILQ